MLQHDFVLLDRSGSMGTGGKWVESLNAVNAYVKKLAEDNVDTGVTLAVFDLDNGKLDYKVVRDRITPQTWSPVTDADASPRGYTPLNDAVGRLVTQAKAGFNGVQYEKVAIIIVTDGEENASREVTVAQAKALLDECRAKGWQVIFLGADYDNVRQATSYGAQGQSILGSMPVAAVASTMRATAEKRSAYGSGQAATMSFSDEEKEQLRKSKG